MLHTLWPSRRSIAPRSPASGSSSRRRWRRPDFDPSDAVEFWDMVNRQDWQVCELTQRGVGPRGYTAGRYSADEADVARLRPDGRRRYMEALRA